MEWFKDLTTFARNNQDGLSALGNIASPIVGGLGAYMTYKGIQDNNALQRQAFGLNQQIANQQLDTINQNNTTVSNAYANSAKKRKDLGTYYTTTA